MDEHDKNPVDAFRRLADQFVKNSYVPQRTFHRVVEAAEKAITMLQRERNDALAYGAEADAGRTRLAQNARDTISEDHRILTELRAENARLRARLDSQGGHHVSLCLDRDRPDAMAVLTDSGGLSHGDILRTTDTGRDFTWNENIRGWEETQPAPRL